MGRLRIILEAAFVLVIVGFCSCFSVQPARSQAKKQTKRANDNDVVKVTSNLVSLDVIVKDKKGKAVTDLKAEDFTISENGAPQNIEFFDSTLNSGNEAAQPLTVTTQPKPRTPTG